MAVTSRLADRDPVVVVSWCLAASLMALSAPPIYLAAELLAVVVWQAATGRIGSLGRLAARGLVPLALALLLVGATVQPGTGPYVWSHGWLHLSIGGATHGLLVWERAAAVLVPLAAAAVSVNAGRLIAGLRCLGTPTALAYVLCAALTAIPSTQALAARVRWAQQSRGIATGPGLAARLTSLPAVVAPVMLSAVVEAGQRSLALEARGFSLPGRSTVMSSEELRVGRWWMYLAICGGGLVLGLVLRWGSW